MLKTNLTVFEAVCMHELYFLDVLLSEKQILESLSSKVRDTAGCLPLPLLFSIVDDITD